MQSAIYIISALLTDYIFSVVTAVLIMAGFEKMGSDPGSPGILLFSLLCVCGTMSIVTAIIMGIARAKYQKEFPAKFSAVIFLLTYFPFHILGLNFTDEQLGFLAAPLGNIFSIMLLFSYIPFFHMTAQGLINLKEYIKRQEIAGNRYSKFLVPTSFVVIILLLGWLITKISSPSPNVLSLQDHWDLLESGGRDWQSDAYLNDITFDVIGIMPYKISATYLSPSTPDEWYLIYINENGEIYDTETRETYPMRESAKLPINREDWIIGSQQAWDLLQKNDTISTCTTSPDKQVPIYLVLDRILSGRLVWELLVSNCFDEGDSANFYLDANTGETIASYSD